MLNDHELNQIWRNDVQYWIIVLATKKKQFRPLTVWSEVTVPSTPSGTFCCIDNCELLFHGTLLHPCGSHRTWLLLLIPFTLLILHRVVTASCSSSPRVVVQVLGLATVPSWDTTSSVLELSGWWRCPTIGTQLAESSGSTKLWAGEEKVRFTNTTAGFYNKLLDLNILIRNASDWLRVTDQFIAFISYLVKMKCYLKSSVLPRISEYQRKQLSDYLTMFVPQLVSMKNDQIFTVIVYQEFDIFSSGNMEVDR